MEVMGKVWVVIIVDEIRDDITLITHQSCHLLLCILHLDRRRGLGGEKAGGSSSQKGSMQNVREGRG